jgi:hypothetical protein
MSCVFVPGPNSRPTPSAVSAAMSSLGMMPPPVSRRSPMPRARINSRISGNSVMWAPESTDSATTSTSSCTAASTTCSGVWWSPV